MSKKSVSVTAVCIALALSCATLSSAPGGERRKKGRRGFRAALLGKIPKKLVSIPFAPKNFVDEDGKPFPINNRYWPLVPGTTFVYESNDGEETNKVRVSKRTRVVAGVTCVVVEDTVFEDDLEVEYTEDWYAQDKFGHVWYMGEDSEEYEYDDDGNLIGTSDDGSWEAGVDGAKAGILMWARPRPRMVYQQEYYEGEAEDRAMVLTRRAEVSIKFGHFEECLKTLEFTPLEPGVFETKYYAPGVGLVFVEELSDERTHELVKIIKPGDDDDDDEEDEDDDDDAEVF